MENNDTKTDYQEIVRAGDQMWEMVEITIGIIFLFCLRFMSIIFYVYREFSSPTWKKYPTQSTNSHSKSQFDLRSYYTNLLKNGSNLPPPLPPSHHPGGMRTMKSLWIG